MRLRQPAEVGPVRANDVRSVSTRGFSPQLVGLRFA